MTKDLRYWIDLGNARGLAGSNATADREDQAIIERGQLRDFERTLTDMKGIGFSRVEQKEPPHPDFLVEWNGMELSIELTEFMDPKIAKEAKHIRKDPSHPLHTEGLCVRFTEDWFQEILAERIMKKNATYLKREMVVDVLLIDNELMDLAIQDTSRWLSSFSVPSCEAIRSIYLQSWYHPGFQKHPTWSVLPHDKIGKLSPRQKSPG